MTMKRIYTYAAIALTLGFTACTQDDTPTVQEQEIRIAARSEGGEGTTPTDDGFTEGQIMTVGIESRVGATSKTDFYKYTYQGGEWVSNNPMKVGDFDAINKVSAYIGFSDINLAELDYLLGYDQFITDKTDINNIICDQSEDLLRYDWMVPAEEIALPTAENPVINAHFLHGMAKVTVGNITYGSEYEETPEITDVCFKSIDECEYNGRFKENGFIGNSMMYGIINVIPFEDITNGTYTALLVTNHEVNYNNEIIIPTEWTLMTLKVNGEEKTVKLVDDPATDKNEALLEAGKHYTFDLKVGKDKVTIEKATTDTDFPGGWNNETEL